MVLGVRSMFFRFCFLDVKAIAFVFIKTFTIGNRLAN